MGRVIETLSQEEELVLVGKVTSSTKEEEWEALIEADVWIDFSHPDAVYKHVEKAIQWKKPLVIGTTGWEENLEEIQHLVNKSAIAVIYAQNFSLGMHFFMQLVSEAAQLINHLDSYDVSLLEIHHRQKVDSPSGTAYRLADILLENIERKTAITTELGGQKIAPHELHIASQRVGSVPGTHTLLFHSNQDTITLTHQAHNRQAWAKGALQAASWIQNKKGFYTINDMMEAFRCNNQES